MISSQTTIAPDQASIEPDLRVCPLCGATRISSFTNAPDRFHLRKELYALLRCSSCSCVWLASPPRPEEMGLHYTGDYHKAIVTGAEHKDGIRWQTHQATLARYKQEGALLDVGCSSGSFLARMNNGHWKLSGIEMDSATAEKAKLSSGAEVFVGDIMKAPFPANSFDVITAFDVLEHMDRPREFLELILYWLRPGGIFFGRVPNIDSWEARLFGTYWYGLELPRHLYHFSQRSMNQLVADVGFQGLSITATGEGSHAHHSTRYVFEAFLEKLGLSPTPLAKAERASLIWRAVRKGLWLSIVAPLSRLASIANAGVVIDVILKKKER